MRLYVVIDNAPAKSLSVSDNPTVGEIRDALKVCALEWYFDDGSYTQAADSRYLSGLVADGLAASGSSPGSAIKVQTIKQGQSAASTHAQQTGHCDKSQTHPGSPSIPASIPMEALAPSVSNNRQTGADSSQAAKKAVTPPSQLKPASAAAAASRPTAAGSGDSSGQLLQGRRAPASMPQKPGQQTVPPNSSCTSCDTKSLALQPSQQQQQQQQQQQSSKGATPAHAAVTAGVINRQALQQGLGQPVQAMFMTEHSSRPQLTAAVEAAVDSDGKRGKGLHSGSECINGHHGVAKLEHALSASSAALALSLQAKQVPAPPPAKLPASSLESTATDKQPGVAVTKGVKQPSYGAATVTAAADVSQPSAAASAAPTIGVASSSAAACRGCGKAEFSGRTVSALGSRWHKDCWKCAACACVLEGGYNTGTQDNLPYHPTCYKEKFGKRCGVCNKVDTDITVEGKPMHRQCFKCAACQAVIASSYQSEKGTGAYYHPDCYQQKFGARCSACNKLLTGKYTVIGGKNLHNECFKCAACEGVIGAKYRTDEEQQSHYHPDCYKEKFDARCSVCNKIDTDITLAGQPMHRQCFKCTACHKVIAGSYNTDKQRQAPYHPDCYKEAFGARCSACNQLFAGKYTVVGGKNLHYECFKCTGCQLAISDKKYQTQGDEKLPYHLACHRNKFDPRCDVCSELVPQEADGRLEYMVSSFWKQKYCKKHSSDGTPRCCSCNRLKPHKQQWLALSLGRRVLCHDCSCTAVRSTSEAQPLYDNVLRFFARTGLPLRERPPMMLVDGDTLDQERKLCREADKEAPIFHTLGMCLLRGHGHVNHVVHSQPGFSSLYKQPSLNATLRPADLSQVEYETKGILVMYGLPWLLTGAILAHEVMHAWVAENNLNCGHSDGDELSAVGEGLAELLGFMWLEAQVSPIVTVAAEAHSSVPIPKAKAAETRTWAQRVAADGRKYFFDPVTRQATWHDPDRWQEVVAPDGCRVFIDQEMTTGMLSASRGPAGPSVQVEVCKDLTADWKEHASADGKKFYHNSKTKESVWSLPDGVTKQVMWFERLSSYYGNQTRTNTNKIYGDGFRAAYEAFQQYGLRNVLLHVKKTNFLPSADSVARSSKDSIKSVLRPSTQ